MRSIPARCLTAGLVLVLSISAARAQGPPPGMPFPMGGPGGPGGPGGQPLVMAAPVQEDLGLSEKQKAQLQKLQASMMQQIRDGMQQAREGGVDPGEMREGMITLRREYESGVSRVLDKAQKARLAQIELQRDGLLAVARSDIAGKLKLTSPQNKKVKTIVDEMRQAQFRAMPAPPGAGPGGPPGGGFPGGPPGGEGIPGGGGGPPMPDFNNPEFRAMMTKMMEGQKKLRDTATAKIGEVLTADQTAAFEKMTGKPFDFSRITPGTPPGEAAPNAAADTPKKEAAPAPAPAPKTQPRTKSRRTQTP